MPHDLDLDLTTTGPMRRDAVIDRWIAETRTLAQALAEDELRATGRRLAAVLQQAAILVELVRDGFAVSVHLGGRELAGAARPVPPP
jgi:hypothetical protein